MLKEEEEEEEEEEWFKSCHYLSQLVFKTIPNLFSIPPKYNLKALMVNYIVRLSFSRKTSLLHHHLFDFIVRSKAKLLTFEEKFLQKNFIVLRKIQSTFCVFLGESIFV